ncbi:MAG: PDZ domain-containing protein [Woeseiaceae bacterium]
MLARVFAIAAISTWALAAPGHAQQNAKELAMEKEVAERLHNQAAADMASVEQRLQEAEARLQAAAREIAELNSGRAPQVYTSTFGKAMTNTGPRLGVSLSSRAVNGKPDGNGIQIMSISPGSAAAEAGLLAGDRLVSIGGQSLKETESQAAAAEIGGVLKTKKSGDTVQVTVLRDGQTKAVDVVLNDQSFSTGSNRFAMAMGEFPTVINMKRFEGGEGELVEMIHEAELLGSGPERFHFLSAGSAWSSMELVELSAELGSYFGTDDGLLVVRAPAEDDLGFEDGDVIKRIGDREPKDVGHAMRILRSYATGETLEVEVLRKKRKRMLNITVPERVGQAGESLFEWFGDGEAEVHFIEKEAPLVP